MTGMEESAWQRGDESDYGSHKPWGGSPDQARWSLKKANEIRVEGFAIRRGIAQLSYEEGKERLAQIILDPPPGAGATRLMRLMISVRRMGKYKASQILRQADILPACQEKPLRMLTTAQRVRIAQALRA